MKAANTNQILDHSILFVTSDLRLTKRLGVPKSKMLPNISRYWKIPHLKIYYLISLTVYIKIINCFGQGSYHRNSRIPIYMIPIYEIFNNI